MSDVGSATAKVYNAGQNIACRGVCCGHVRDNFWEPLHENFYSLLFRRSDPFILY